MVGLAEWDALARLQRLKTSYQTRIKRGYEHAARDCRVCPTAGVCCTDAHFVNVRITRLEAVAIRETIERTPRLTAQERHAVYQRAREAITRYDLRARSDDETQTYSCPLFVQRVGCLVHQRAKPAPCIQHACYDAWQDLPPVELEWRAERRVEQLNERVYGTAWAWLALPVWLTLVDPECDGAELRRLTREWITRRSLARPARRHAKPRPRRSLPVISAA